LKSPPPHPLRTLENESVWPGLASPSESQQSLLLVTKPNPGEELLPQRWVGAPAPKPSPSRSLNQLVQTLLAQFPAVVHGCPSFALQEPPLKVCPAGQLQRPALQPSVPQVTPQAPQFAPSVCVLTQRPLQAVVPPEHWQMPATQVPTEQLLAAVLHC
jgi:hypothetical protein